MRVWVWLELWETAVLAEGVTAHESDSGNALWNTAWPGDIAEVGSFGSAKAAKEEECEHVMVILNFPVSGIS